MNSAGQSPRMSVTDRSSQDLLKPKAPELSTSSLHVWEFPLTITQSPVEYYASVLSGDERVRAARFHFERDARRFTVARATVRSILGGYAGVSNGDLRFDYSQPGKPSIAGSTTGIRFNVSHSGDLGMLAVTLGREVGVDVETAHPTVEIDKLAERYFSEQERATLRELPLEQRERAFLRCWTCKEAFLKAQGLGLGRSLDSFDVEVSPERPARLVATRPDFAEAGRWSLHEVPTQNGFASAVAWEGPIEDIEVLHCR
jgi:4'-phosphopantetheinyl transferase